MDTHTRGAHSLPLAGEPRTSLPRVKPALAAKGFRPFFLLAGLFALAIVPSWLLMLYGALPLGTYLDASSWHAHEMIFGYTVAVIAGFLLTAVSNWTQRETCVGLPLLGLASLWLLGRTVMFTANALPYGIAALSDLAFIPVLAAVLARPLIATRNRRNYPLLGLLAGLWACDVLVHGQALGGLPMGSARRACLVALDLVLLIVMIVIGRVLPMFTRNATGATTVRSVRALDGACLASMLLLTLGDGAWPAGSLCVGAAALTAVLAAARARYWGAQHSLRHPLLWILHAGYGWLVLGLALRALAGLGVVPSSLATHALTVGVIGTLTLGMMARVALGHTGRLLEASRPMVWAFIAINIAAAARALLPQLLPSRYALSLWIAGAAWTLAFLLFVLRYTAVLTAPRVDGKPG